MDLPGGPFEDVSTIGEQGQGLGAARMESFSDLFDLREGGPLSRLLNRIPGVNAVSKVHDTFQIWLGRADLSLNLDQRFGLRTILNYPGMPIAAGISYGASLSGSPAIPAVAESLFD